MTGRAQSSRNTIGRLSEPITYHDAKDDVVRVSWIEPTNYKSKYLHTKSGSKLCQCIYFFIINRLLVEANTQVPE